MPEAAVASAPSPSPSEAPSAPAASAAPAAASLATTPAASTTPSPQPAASQAPAAAAPARPEWAPDQFWDAQKNELKGTDFRKAFDDLAAFKAEQDVKASAVPAKPEDYKIELPADFKAPEGVEVQFNEADPLMAQARATAKELGLDQSSFSRLLALHAGARVNEAAQIKAAREAEISKLGPTAQARVDTVVTWMNAKLGGDNAKALSQMLVTAAHVKAFEDVIKLMSSQGAGTFGQNGRDVRTAKLDDDAWNKLSPAQKLNYSRTGDPNRAM